jgi:molybdopterin synthase sulfur carrier subunit
MQVRLFATLRPIVGGAVVDLEAGPGDSVRALLDELITRWPPMKKELFDGEGKLHNNIHVFINGRDVRYLGGLDMAIPEDASIRIFPPVGGGEVTSETAESVGPHDYYGVPLWMMKEYLAQLGASEAGENVFEAQGWRAVIEPAPWKQVGSLRVGGTRATFRGEPQALAALFERLHLKTLRGGG